MSVDTIRLEISGMSCGHCVASAEKALNAVPGVETVVVNLDPGEAIITGRADAEALIAAIAEVGYEARVDE